MEGLEMKVFVTGHRGYIGVHLIELLKKEGHYVAGCDVRLFEGCAWEPFVEADIEITKDIRNLSESELEGYDCVMHLAAISNDPMGELNPRITLSVNRDGAVHVATIAKKAGVPRFLFSGSCSVYGKGEELDLDETALLSPQSTYAISKVEAEQGISELADSSFTPVFLRNATAYGHSPMLRVDLVANNLLACAFARGDIRIMSDGRPWRPLIHCRDIARAFMAFMVAPKELIHDRRINVGANGENYQVRDVANEVKALIPAADIVYTGEVGVDPRDYRVKFDLLGGLLPSFSLEHDLKIGMTELYKKFQEHRFDIEDFNGDRFVRQRTLKRRLHLLIDYVWS
jgi:nucleoside-diphosphate-sugar epimerase